jgi:flagellar biosynthesis chaperone FliJ
MPVSRPLRRLLRVLHLEEEETRRTLESALGTLRQLENALAAAQTRDRSGRGLVLKSAVTGELADRLAGLEESLAAARRTVALEPRLRDAEQQVAARREVYLAQRVERRQAETLVEQAETRDALEAARRTQRSLDDWHLNRLRRAEAESAAPTDAGDADSRKSES